MRKIVPTLVLFCLNLQLFSQAITIDPEVRMLALGDSYTIGQSVGLSERWPHQFVAELRLKGVMADDPDYIATTGWTTKNLLQGIETKLNPDKDYNLVSILIGVNNQYQGIAISSYEPDLKEITERALAIVNNDVSRVFMLSIPDYAYTPFGGGSPTISQEIDAYNAINKKVAAFYKISYTDITGISRQGLINSQLVANDGLHPSGVQYSEWVLKLLPKLKISQTVPVIEIESIPTKQTAGLRVYPNPASSQVRICSEGELKILRIRDVHGKPIREIENPPSLFELDLSGYIPGMYILEGISEDGRELTRLVLH